MEISSGKRSQNINVDKPWRKSRICVEQEREGTPGESSSKQVKLAILKAEKKLPIEDKRQRENHVSTYTSKMVAKNNVAVETVSRRQISTAFEEVDVDGKIQPKSKNKKSTDDSRAYKLQDEQKKLNQTAVEVSISKKQASMVSDETEKTDRFSLGFEQNDEGGANENIEADHDGQRSIISENKQSKEPKGTDKEKIPPTTPYGLFSAHKETVERSKVIKQSDRKIQAVNLARASKEDRRTLHSESGSTCLNSPSMENGKSPSIFNVSSTKTGFSHQSYMTCTQISPLKLRIRRFRCEGSDGKQNAKLKVQYSWTCQNNENETQDSGSRQELKRKRSQRAVSSPETDYRSNTKMPRESEYDSLINEEANRNGESTETADEPFYNCREDSFPLLSPVVCTSQISEEVKEMVVDKSPNSEWQEGFIISPYVNMDMLRNYYYFS